MDNNDYKEEELFFSGRLTDGYNYFGCHFEGGKARFRVWVEKAKSVSVVGDFNNWKIDADVMENDGGVWRALLDGVNEYDAYKYYIETLDGRGLYKSDPYAFHSETKEKTASKTYDLSHLEWSDEKWQNRAVSDESQPMSIYEAHMGSWRKYYDGNYFDYFKFADEICPYLKAMNFTHLELMGIAEYPFDGSWGYQVTGYYAPTSRYGTPEGFAYLVNKLHKNNLGIIVDWVPGHFPKDASGLYEFDGEPMYEPVDELRREHKEWGTRCFDYGRREVQSFLISNAFYWLDIYHVDGLRVDAVASMLYLDYGRKEWRPNKFGGHENLEAIEFFKNLNGAVAKKFPNAMMIAEESTAWPRVTYKVEDGGLGFNYKWNMGWMNDTLDYAKTDPLFRAGKHNNLTFSMTYAFSEKYILPVSHDEVVYGKCSLVNKMAGTYEEKFASYRAYLMNMFAHPGKKLLFMGTEFAQFGEWNYAKELDWSLLAYPAHFESSKFMAFLNKFYITHKPLYEIENSWAGFEWLVADDNLQNVIAYERRDKAGDRIIVVINFSPIERKNYRIGISAGEFVEVLHSDVSGFNEGGATYKTQKTPSHNKETSIIMDIKPLASIYMICKQKKARTSKAETQKVSAEKKPIKKKVTKKASE